MEEGKSKVLTREEDEDKIAELGEAIFYYCDFWRKKMNKF